MGGDRLKVLQPDPRSDSRAVYFDGVLLFIGTPDEAWRYLDQFRADGEEMARGVPPPPTQIRSGTIDPDSRPDGG